MTKISIIHPSRNRPKQAYNAYKHWTDHASNENEIEYILSIDFDEPQFTEYAKLFAGVYRIIGVNKNAIEAVNAAAKISTGDIIVSISDDFECYKNWDIDIVKSFYIYIPMVLKTYDGAEKWIVTLPIMTRKYYLMQGYIYNPIYSHLFCDTELTHVSELQGCLIFRNDLTFIHRHPMNDKSIKSDAEYKRVNETFNSGMKIYFDRVKAKFDLDTQKDVWDLGTEAQAHINWCKERMK